MANGLQNTLTGTMTSPRARTLPSPNFTLGLPSSSTQMGPAAAPPGLGGPAMGVQGDPLGDFFPGLQRGGFDEQGGFTPMGRGAQPNLFPDVGPGDLAGVPIPQLGAPTPGAEGDPSFLASLFANPQFMQGLFQLAAAVGGGRYAGAAGQGVAQVAEQMRETERQRILQDQRQEQIDIQSRGKDIEEKRVDLELQRLANQEEERKAARNRFRNTSITGAIESASQLRDPRIAHSALTNALNRIRATPEEMEYAFKQLTASLGRYTETDPATGRGRVIPGAVHKDFVGPTRPFVGPVRPDEEFTYQTPEERMAYRQGLETQRRSERQLEIREETAARQKTDADRVNVLRLEKMAHQAARAGVEYDQLSKEVKNAVPLERFDVLKATRLPSDPAEDTFEQGIRLLGSTKEVDPDTGEPTQRAIFAQMLWDAIYEHPTTESDRLLLISRSEAVIENLIQRGMWTEEQVVEINEAPEIYAHNREVLAKVVKLNVRPVIDPDNPLKVLDPDKNPEAYEDAVPFVINYMDLGGAVEDPGLALYRALFPGSTATDYEDHQNQVRQSKKILEMGARP